MIRKADTSDIHQILEVISDAKDLFKSKNSTQWQDTDGYPNYQTFDNDIRNGGLYIKELNNKIVGVCYLSKQPETNYDKIYNGSWLNDEKYYVIHRLAVKKEYYGYGVAKELMRYMETITKADLVKNIKVDTMEENLPMNSLLQSLNYQLCGVILLDRPNVLVKERLAYQKILD